MLVFKTTLVIGYASGSQSVCRCPLVGLWSCLFIKLQWKMKTFLIKQLQNQPILVILRERELVKKCCSKYFHIKWWASYLENRWDSQFKNSQSQKKSTLNLLAYYLLRMQGKKDLRRSKMRKRGLKTLKMMSFDFKNWAFLAYLQKDE